MGSAAPVYDAIPNHRHRFINYVGDGFLLGTALGSAVYAIKGFRNPAAAGGRLAGAGHAALVNAPRIGGHLGALSALFCASESAMIALTRRKDDPWNSIVAGAASLGLFHMHWSPRTAAVSALFGAAVSVALVGVDCWISGESSSDTTCASGDPLTRTKNNPGLLAPATNLSRQGPLSWLRSSALATSITSNKDLQELDLMSRKFLLEKIREGFHSPTVEEKISSLYCGNHI